MSTSCEVTTVTARQAVNRANEAVDAGNLELASSWFKKAAELEPNAPILWILYADCELSQGRKEGAEEAIQRAQRLATDQPRVLRSIGRMQLEMGSLQLAEQSLRSSIEIDPTATAYIFLFVTLIRQEKRREAKRALFAALELEPDNEEVHCNLGVLYRSSQQYDLAERHLRRAIEIDPGYVVAISELKHMLSGREQWQNSPHV